MVFRLTITLIAVLQISFPLFSQGMIIGHNCTDITRVPEYWIVKAKNLYRLSYGHTSHGSQIISGMGVLMASSAVYSFNHDGTGGALSLWDTTPTGDLGNPDRTTWAQRTRDMLDTPGCDRNIVMWSWCGQVSSATWADINTYLTLMNQLEIDYPGVTFIYMTGHLDGTGEGGNLHIRNNQIREFCRKNNKILFDFADIESYDPDGKYFLDKNANDGCYYDSDGNGSLDANWAVEWCSAHPGKCSSCSCAHSESLNCDLKGRAFWWMMARLAGWNDFHYVFSGHDFDGDGSSEIAVWRPSNGRWFIWGTGVFLWGTSGDVPVPGDYDGDGTTDIAVWRPSNGKWFIKDSTIQIWGASGDIPVPADYDGDGSTDVAVWRPSNGKWFIKDSSSQQWGTLGDIPVPGDYDGDNMAEIAVWRPTNGLWYIRGLGAYMWGTSGDIPVPGDYDGDNKVEIAVWRPPNGRWFIKDSASQLWGILGDIPVPGDYNGDGITDIAVWRPSKGKWFIKNIINFLWGKFGDIPVVR
jgi:hypothetical protein